MPLLPKCRCKPANGCHESYDSRLHFVCIRCVALHLRDDQRSVIARKVCVRWTRASASLTCSSRWRHTRQNSVGDGRGPVAFRKSGEKPHMPFRPWENPESRLRLRTRRLKKQMHFRSDAQLPKSVKTAIAVLTERVPLNLLTLIVDK